MCVAQSVSTFRTPTEWESLNEATRRLKTFNPTDQLVIASEAVLYQSDLKGYRLEFNPEAMSRAALEWRIALRMPEKPLSLVEFYWKAHSLGFLDDSKPIELQGRSRFPSKNIRLLVADVGPTEIGPRRKAWREAIRNRPNTTILADEPGYLIAELR
jgi:hypothetical protein